MKKLIALLLAAALALTVALAENTIDPLPTLDAHAGTGESIEIQIDGQRVALEFDASPQYSSIEGGLVQASFYKYSDDGSRLWELYITFPESAQPGMVITPDYAALTNEDSSVVLIASDTDTQREQYYMSSLMDGSVYPEGSDYAIAIDDITAADGKTTYSGKLSATLICLDMASGAVLDTLVIEETPFRFTMGGGSGDERHDIPQPTLQPDDMRRV